MTDLPNFIIPVGTQVVLRADRRVPGSDAVKPAGSIAEVLEAPTTNRYPYLLRFVDGVTMRAKSSEPVVRLSCRRCMRGGSVMPARLLNLRFGVRRPDGHVSSVWKLWTWNKEVYLAMRSLRSNDKYSFHYSGRCLGLRKEDRRRFEWDRPPMPPAGTMRVSRVAWIGFHTDFLSRQLVVPAKQTYWIKAAPSGAATCVELCYTREPEEAVLKALGERKDQHLLRHTMLPSGEAFYISYYYAAAPDEKDLTVPGDGKVNDLVFSSQDPHNTGRPIRICLGPPPKDGETLMLWEYGGYALPRP